MKTVCKLVFPLFLIFLLSSCASATPDLSSKAPTPQTGMTTVVGRLVSASTGKPFANENVALPEIHRNEKGDAAYAYDTRTSPATMTDKDGYFVIKDVRPSEYAVWVGDPMTRYLVLNDLSTGDVKIWKLEPDKILNLGELKFDFNK